MTFPVTAAFAAAILALIQVFLMVTVGNKRRAAAISLGDGDDEEMLRLIRRHGNFTENAPMFLILLTLLEMSGGASLLVMILAVLFIVTRLFHALALSSADAPIVFRIIGAVGTLLSLVVGAAALAYQAAGFL